MIVFPGSHLPGIFLVHFGLLGDGVTRKHEQVWLASLLITEYHKSQVHLCLKDGWGSDEPTYLERIYNKYFGKRFSIKNIWNAYLDLYTRYQGDPADPTKPSRS